jgi:tRNA threonylcarbamoyl adenosine modification protein (Sua5/YciO/YrdC/YwlC family)
MSQFFRIHPDNPQQRLITQAVEIIRSGGIIAYPTDCAYALGCHIGDKKAIDRIREIRRLEQDHHFALVCKDLSELGLYAKVSNSAYRQIKAATPGAFTFILPATKEVPKRLIEPKRKTIGVRVPDNEICRALLATLGEPIMSTTLILPGDEFPLTDPDEIRDIMEHQIELVIDGGFGGIETTTVVNMEDDYPEIVREGRGDVSLFTG